jgi:hypothetical protein
MLDVAGVPAALNRGSTFEVSDERSVPRKSKQAPRHSRTHNNRDQLRVLKYKRHPHRSTSLLSRRRPGSTKGDDEGLVEISAAQPKFTLYLSVLQKGLEPSVVIVGKRLSLPVTPSV